MRAELSPVVELNRALTMAMRGGPLAGLELIDAIPARGDLPDYHLARADLCRRLRRTAEAPSSYERSLALTQQEPGTAVSRKAVSGIGLTKETGGVEFQRPSNNK